MYNKSLEDRINKLKANNSKSEEDVPKLKSSIAKLTDSYYTSFLSDNYISYNSYHEELKDLIEANIEDYPNINNFVNYCLLNSIIRLLKDNLNLDIEVPVFNKVRLEEEPELIKHYCTDLVISKISDRRLCSNKEGVEENEKC